MWLDELMYRDKLNIGKDVTFGVEIEFDKARKRDIKEVLDKAYYDKVIDKKWDVVDEETICESGDKNYMFGGEAVSDILTDNENTWKNINYTCDKIKIFDGKINKNCGAHVHVGADVFRDDMKYYDRLMKLWLIYEDVILRFCYGEFDRVRDLCFNFARSPYLLFKIIYDHYYNKHKLNLSFEKFVDLMGNNINKNFSLSFCRLSKEFLGNRYKIINDWYNYRTLEFRGGNGTLNPVIWQNYINLYTKLLLCCLDDNKNWDIIDKRFIDTYNCETLENYNYEKALEFSNFVFVSEIDKHNFMLQYMKNNSYSKVKKRDKLI
ncbi:MAG: amidoligase family protein [Bacilli bacterium]|nr:amidoligase family protein [Bacilli bacterium]